MNHKTITAGVVVALAGMFWALSTVAQVPPRTPATPGKAAPPPAAKRPVEPTAPPPAEPTPPPPAQRSVVPAVKNDELIARVGTSDVTAEEVRAVIATLDQRQQAALAQDPALLSQTVRALLANRLVLKEALAKKWEQTVAAQLERARENVIVDTYLKSVAEPPDNFPSEAEIKAVYDANASAFLVPRKFQLAHILIAVAKDADKAVEDKARRKLDEVLKKLKQPRADFAAIATSDSDDAASAKQGGEIGWLTEAELRPEVRSQVIGLAQSAFTEPVRLDDGWHILKLLDTQAAHPTPLAQVREALVQRIRAERAEANRRAYVAELLKKNPPVINELALSKLLATVPAAPPR
jgi:parvulin-like peptidyl-prolyl isomerase